MVKFIPVLLGLLAAALKLPDLQADPASWLDVGVLGTVTWGTVEMARAFLLPKLDGFAVQAFALAIGVVLSILLGLGGYGDGAVTDWVLRGLAAVFGAYVLDGGLKKAAGKPLGA